MIVIFFTVGTLINRRRLLWELDSRKLDDPERSPGLTPRPRLRSCFYHLFTQPFTTYPFLVEIIYWNLTYWYVFVLGGTGCSWGCQYAETEKMHNPPP